MIDMYDSRRGPSIVLAARYSALKWLGTDGSNQCGSVRSIAGCRYCMPALHGDHCRIHILHSTLEQPLVSQDVDDLES